MAYNVVALCCCLLSCGLCTLALLMCRVIITNVNKRQPAELLHREAYIASIGQNGWVRVQVPGRAELLDIQTRQIQPCGGAEGLQNYPPVHDNIGQVGAGGRGPYRPGQGVLERQGTFNKGEGQCRHVAFMCP